MINIALSPVRIKWEVTMNATVHARPFTVQVSATLTAIIRPELAAGGFSAEIPALPGCCTQGETLDEVQANLREAAQKSRHNYFLFYRTIFHSKSKTKIVVTK